MPTGKKRPHYNSNNVYVRVEKKWPFLLVILITWNLSSSTRSTYNESMIFRTTKTTSRDVNEARRPRTCSRPCAFEEKQNRKKENTKKSAPPKTHHEIHSSPASRHGRLIDQQEDIGNNKNTYSISVCLGSDMTIKIGTTCIVRTRYFNIL